jgi:hypothetical protein
MVLPVGPILGKKLIGGAAWINGCPTPGRTGQKRHEFSADMAAEVI